MKIVVVQGDVLGERYEVFNPYHLCRYSDAALVLSPN